MITKSNVFLDPIIYFGMNPQVGMMMMMMMYMMMMRKRVIEKLVLVMMMTTMMNMILTKMKLKMLPPLDPHKLHSFFQV